MSFHNELPITFFVDANVFLLLFNWVGVDEELIDTVRFERVHCRANEACIRRLDFQESHAIRNHSDHSDLCSIH